MAALDTLYFDLKINDLTGEQMKAIKSRLGNELKMNLDIGKDIQRAIGNTNTNIKIGADISAVELAVKRIMELVSKGDLSKNQISELTAITNAIKVLRQEAQKVNKELKNTKVGDSPSSYVSNIKIDNRDGNIINSIKDKLEIAWQKAIALENELKGIYNSGKNIGGNDPLTKYVKKLTEQLNVARDSILGYETALSKMQNMQGSVSINNTPKSDFEIKKDEANIEARKRVWQNWASEQDKIEKQQAENAKRDAIRAAEKEKEDERLLKKVYAQNAAMMKLEATIESMELAMRRYQAVSNSLGKPESIEAAIKKMREYIERAKEASKSGEQSVNFLRSDYLSRGSSNIEKAITTETQLERQRQKAQAASEAQDKLAASHYRASIAADSHARASIRLGSSLTGLVSITGDLRNQIGMLVSVYTVEHLLKNVVQIGGEFEKQKLAMGSMLGSLEQADDIFNRMKNLALTSPFNFKDLSNYSRQLTAFGTPYKDLYDTTNRLADISAGLGGDMSRLVLAFSQVKAAAYLRGQEMRQFTEFGVSLPDLLAKKYTEAEGRIVTAGDVIERVSKRMVSFNDVKDVLWKSTDKGGQFYGMQDVLAQSTSGMASNLKDAIDTMYYDIANSKSGVIKGTIKDITELVSHWRELSSALGAATILWGAHRIAMAANNRLLGMGTAETLKGVMASKQEEASVLRRKALYGELSAEEKARIANVKVLTIEDVKQLAASKAINADSLMRLVNSKKITTSQALEVASMMELTVGQRKYIYELQFLDTQLARTSGFWDRLGISMQKASMMSASKIGTAMSGIGSFLGKIFTKGNLLMAGAFVGMDIVMSNNQMTSQIEENNKQSIKNAEDGLKSLNEFILSHPVNLVLKGGNKDEIDKLIDAYKEQITSTPLDMSGFITNIDTITDATQKLQALRDEMQAMRDANESISKNGNPFAIAQKESDTGFWRSTWAGINSVNQKVGDFLNSIGILPDWLRRWSTAGNEANKSITTVISDVKSRLSDLESEIIKLNDADISKGLDKMKKDYPEIARGIQQMRDAGASNMEVVKAMVNVEYDKGENFLPQISATTINRWREATDVLSNKMAQQIEYGMNRINASMDKADVEGKTEKWRLAFIKSAEEQGKALGYEGDSLEQWTFMVEDAVSKNSARIQDHPKVWQDMYNGIKQILWKNGYDINNATKEQVNQAFQTYKNETSKTKPWLANFLAMMNAYTRKNPIYIWNEMRFIGQEGGAVLSGRGKELSSNYTLNSKYKADLANIKNDKDAAEYIKGKYDTYQQDLKDAKSNRKKVNDLNNKWNEFYNDWNSEMDVNFIIGGQKTHKPKKTGGGSKEDTFLKDMRARLDSVKKAMDEYKKWIQAGKSESSAIVDVESMGIFAKGTFSNMSTESELNAWYKRTIKNLEDMMRKNKPSTERKKFLNEILSNLTDFDRDEFKRDMDSKSQIIEEELRKLSKKWSLYNSLYNETGNRELSGRIAFGTNGNSFNTASEEMLARISGMSGLKDSAQKIVTMSDGQIKARYSGEIQSELIKYVAAYKNYLESEESERERMYSDSIKSTMGYYDKLKRIDTEYNRKIEIAKRNGDTTTASRLQGQKQNKIDALNPDYALFYQSALIFTKDKARELANVLRENLARDFKNGAISAKDYAETLEKINKQLDYSEKRKSYFASYQEGGFDELFKKMFEEGSNKILQGSTQYKSGVDLLNSTNDTNKQQDALVQMTQGQKTMVAGNNIMQAASKAQGAIAVVDKIVKMIDQIIQALKQAFDSIAEMADSYGHNTDKGGWLTAKTAISGLSEFSSKAKAGWDSLKNGDIAGAISNNISAYASIFTNFNKYHDKKLDNKIQDLGQQITEENLLLKTIEDKLKYHLGNAAVGTFINTDAVKAVKEADATIASIKSKGKLSMFDLMALSKANQTLKESWATVQYMKDGNVYNYQRNLYKQQLEQLKEQKQAEEDKKKTDQSKINDYNSQIEEMETKIAQFSLDLANSLYGIDIKGWASQLGDALFEAWQKGESGADAFKKKANDIIASVANKWATQRIIEPAMQKLMDDMVGKDGQGGWLGADNDMSMADMINNLAPDILGVQTSIDTYNKAMTALNEGFKKQGIDIKNTSSSSTANAISGVSEQEANIIAAYMDAIRQDTYNNRLNLQKLVDDGISVSEKPIMQAQLQQLQSIASNTHKNMELVGEIKSMFYDITIGNKKIYIN